MATVITLRDLTRRIEDIETIICSAELQRDNPDHVALIEAVERLHEVVGTRIRPIDYDNVPTYRMIQIAVRDPRKNRTVLIELTDTYSVGDAARLASQRLGYVPVAPSFICVSDGSRMVLDRTLQLRDMGGALAAGLELIDIGAGV